MPSLPRSETINILARALGYAATALAAFIAGFALESRDISYSDILLLLALWAVSLPFFLHYAIAFHPPSHGAVSEGAVREAETTARISLPAISVAAFVVLIAQYENSTGTLPGLSYLVLVLMVALTSYSYGAYLSRTCRTKPIVRMRHRLIWPAVLTITFSLYIGYLLAVASVSFSMLLPLLLTVIVFGATFNASREVFLFVTIGLAALLTLAVSIFPARVPIPFANFAYHLGLAAYLAVFEAWSITAQFAYTEEAPATHDDSAPQTTSFRHYMATGHALCVAGLALPIYFLFSDLGRWFFLYAAVAHVALCFGIWYWAGGKTESQALKRLAPGWWLWVKTAAGYIFLGILVWDTYRPQYPKGRLAVDLLNWGFYFGIIGLIAAIFSTAWLVFFLLSKFVPDIPQLDVVGPLTSSRRGYLGTLCVLGFLLALIPLFIHEASPSLEDGATIVYKAERVYHWYLLVALASLMWLMIRNFRDFGKRFDDAVQILRERSAGQDSPSDTSSTSAESSDLVASETLSRTRLGRRLCAGLILSRRHLQMDLRAILASSRLTTSLLIGLTVLGPALANGASSEEALWWAIPFILSAAAGFLLNDYFDAARDRISKPYRMIPQGRLAPNQALRSAIMISVITGILLLLSPVGSWLRLLQLVALAGVLVYNYVLRKVAMLKGLYTAGLTILPLVFVLAAVGRSAFFWILPLSAFLYIASRETFMDLLDEEGDRATGLRTPAVVLGHQRATRLAFSLGVLALLVLCVLVLLTDAQHDRLFLLASIVSSVFIGLLWRTESRGGRRRLIRLSWIPMLLAVAILL